MMSAHIAALLLSVLCSFFYNLWVYDVESVIREEGDWQGRVIGNFDDEELKLLCGFANIKSVAVNQELSFAEPYMTYGNKVYDLYFHNPRTIYEDMTLLSEKFGLHEEQMAYHYELLAMYFIRIPGDEAPRMVMPLYFTVLMFVCFSLILVIHNAFAVSMNARVHQLGVLSGIGATPKQIRACLLQEAGILCMLPLAVGSLLGVALGYGMMRMMENFAVQMTGRHSITFCYHPMIFLLTFLLSALTVLVSAWIPARKLAKLTPLEAIRGAQEPVLRHKRHSTVLSFFFGVEAELAVNALKAQKKSLRTSTLSLTLSFLGFTVVLSFLTLSVISTQYTYFAKYQDVWDVMATVKEAKIEELDMIGALREAEEAQGAFSCVAYQKAYAMTGIPEAQMSRKAESLASALDTSGGVYFVEAPIIILDDAGFLEYCGQIGAAPSLDGVVILNRIWDSINSNFRYREYIPYVKGDSAFTVLHSGMGGQSGETATGQETDSEETNTTKLPVLAYTDTPPILREEYDDYALVHIVPLSLWKNMKGQITDVEPDAFIRVLAGRADKDEAAAEKLQKLESLIVQYTGQRYETETENRVQEKITNDRLILGYKIVVGTLCALLAVIGIANVFSYTMGFMRQRKKELARYLSVGMTPAQIKKMFCIEIMVIAGRPVLITLPLTVLFVELSARASYLNPMEFWQAAPIVPMLVFIVAVFGFVMFAYYIGGKRVLKENLAKMLRYTM